MCRLQRPYRDFKAPSLHIWNHSSAAPAHSAYLPPLHPLSVYLTACCLQRLRSGLMQEPSRLIFWGPVGGPAWHIRRARRPNVSGSTSPQVGANAAAEAAPHPPQQARAVVQAYYLLGVSLRYLERHEESCKHLERALEGAIEERDAIKDEIWRELAACKYARWQLQADERRGQRARFRKRLETFMDSHFGAHPEVRWRPLLPAAASA